MGLKCDEKESAAMNGNDRHAFVFWLFVMSFRLCLDKHALELLGLVDGNQVVDKLVQASVEHTG